MPPAGPESVSPGKLSTHLSVTAPGLPMALSPSGLLSASLQRCKPQLMTTQHDKPAAPNLLSPASSAALKSSSAGVDPTAVSVSNSSSVGSRPHEPVSANYPQTYPSPAVSSHLSPSPAALLPPVAVTSAAPESPTAQPPPTLPLPTTQASRTVHSFLSAPPTSSASLGALQSSNTEPSSPNTVLPQASRISSPEKEHCNVSQTSASYEQMQAGVEKQQTQDSFLSDSDYSVLDHTPVRKPSHFHRVDQSTDDESFNSSSQYESYSSFTTPSRMDVSSILENSSLMHDGGSRADQFTDSDSSFPARKQTPQYDRTPHTEEGASTDMDTTRESICSLNNTLDSTKEAEVSETQRTLDSLVSTGGSVLDSSLNNSSQIQDSSVASEDVSMSHSFVSPQPSHKGKI